MNRRVRTTGAQEYVNLREYDGVVYMRYDKQTMIERLMPSGWVLVGGIHHVSACERW